MEKLISWVEIPATDFKRAVKFYNAVLGIELQEIDCGTEYYDQSHMINDFKLLSGKTPTQYFSECEPYSNYFQ